MSRKCPHCGRYDQPPGPLYVVEARTPEGALDFAEPLPPVQDWTEDDLAALAWRHNPDATLDGTRLLSWVSDNVDPRWRTRRKTW